MEGYVALMKLMVQENDLVDEGSRSIIYCLQEMVYLTTPQVLMASSPWNVVPYEVVAGMMNIHDEDQLVEIGK